MTNKPPPIIAEVPPEDRMPKFRPIAERLATVAEARDAAHYARWAIDYDTLDRWSKEPSISEQIAHQQRRRARPLTAYEASIVLIMPAGDRNPGRICVDTPEELDAPELKASINGRPHLIFREDDRVYRLGPRLPGDLEAPPSPAIEARLRPYIGVDLAGSSDSAMALAYALDPYGLPPSEFRKHYMGEWSPEPREDPAPAIELLRREILAGRLSLSMVTSALGEADREARRRPRDVRDLP